MNSQTILYDTALCAIVRDEIMNPAGGIKRFVDSHVPFVEEAVIVDTGSKDRTYEILKASQERYPHLVVPEPIRFEGFANARNYSLEQATKDWILVLDADELLTSEDLIKLEKKKLSEPQNFDFSIDFISPEGKMIYTQTFPGRKTMSLFGNGTRFFRRGIKYHSNLQEVLETWNTRPAWLSIKHFLPSEKAFVIKHKKWYKFGRKNQEIAFDEEIINRNVAPSQTPGFEQWKQYNPQRDLYN